MYSKEYYHNLRNKFLPEKLKVVFVLESPPGSGKYFYDPNGSKGELLFRVMMRYIEYEPENKLDGLKRFREKGYFLIDSTYIPVDKIKKYTDKNRVIISNISNFVNDVESIIKNKRVKIIPIKKNICQIMSGVLESLNYRVLNQNIPFPDPSQINNFFEKLNYLKREYELP